MKEDENDFFLSIHMSKERTSFEEIQHKIKYGIFGMYYLLLKNQDINLWLEIIGIALQLLQLIAFPFNQIFSSSWKQEKSFTEISNVLQYFQIVPFFADNQEMYLIAFYLCVLVVLIILINMLYISYTFTKNRLVPSWILQILRTLLPFTINSFFLPIFSMFMSIFSCSGGKNTANTSIQCWSGAYYCHISFSIIFGIFFLLNAILSHSCYFETKFGTHNPTAKTTSRCDQFFLLTKIILVIVFTFIKNSTSSSSQWVAIVFLVFFSGYMTFTYFELQPYYTKLMQKMMVCLCLIFFWSNFVLLLCKVFENSSFNGGIGLFFLGIPVILLIIFTENDQMLNDLFLNLGKFSKGDRALNQIQSVIDLIDQKENSRNSKILLNGYIDQCEENCTLKDCPLKKYIHSLTKSNIDAIVFLLQHCETMYQSAISKFPTCTSIRISYAFFLLERLNKKQQASLELANTEKHFPKFEEQFIIFRYQKLLEEQSTELNDNEDNFDIVSNIEYKNQFTLFKNSITKVTSLYLEFWSLLLNPNQDCQEDLTKLNDYGTKINILVEEIHTHFDKIQKLKHNDPETIKYYSDFLSDILNDKEKAEKFKTKLNDIEDAKQAPDENNLMNIDINNINSNSEYQYIIVSASHDKFGVITNLSLGVCTMFGYTKNELVGKSLEVIMPEIFHKEHREVLLDKVNEFKKLSVDVNDMKNYKTQYKDITTFGRNKSRYLVQLAFKTALVPTENSDNVFIAKIWQDFYSMNNVDHATCYIITNNYLIIQNFTPNSVSLLGMSSGAINSTVEITNFIKEFNEDYLPKALEISDKPPEQKLLVKKQILNKNYRIPKVISWKRSDINDTKFKSSKIVEPHTLINEINDPTNYGKIGGNEDYFILSVNDAMIRGKQEGYIFKFETVTAAEKNAYIASQKSISTDKLLKIVGKRESSKNDESARSRHIENKFSSGLALKNVRETQMPKNFIDQNYIPNSAMHFQLDPKALSYKVNNLNNNAGNAELKDYLRVEAIKKIQPPNQKKTKEESNEESEEEEDDESSSGTDEDQNITSSLNDSSNPSHSHSDDLVVNIPKKEAVKVVSQDKYYKVNMSHIKFSIYDFSKKMVVDVRDWDRRDQVDQKMNEDHKKKESDSSVVSNDKTEEKQISIPGASVKPDGATEANKETVLIKQIEYALGKEEAQPSIAKLRWFSFFSFLLFLGCGAAMLTVILLSYKTMKENITIVGKAFDLLIMNSFGIYYTRELTLLYNERYTQIPTDRDTYLNRTVENTLDIFRQSHEVITYILTTFLTVSSKNTKILDEKQILTTIIEDDFNISSFNLTLNSALIEANTALFHIGHEDLKNIIPTNKDVFFYLYNSVNDVANGETLLANTYLDELSVNKKNIRLTTTIILCCIIVVLGVIYFFISFAYEGVAKRKESYLEVFFEIGNNVIKASLEKCENFTKKIQSDSMSDSISTADDSDISQDKLIIEKDSGRKEHRSKRSNNSSRETKMFKLKAVIMLALIGIFSLLVNIFFWELTEKVIVYMTYYKNTIELENEYFILFNALREYLYEPKGRMYNQDIYSYLTEKLDKFYMTTQEKETYISLNQEKLPKEFIEKYVELYSGDCCRYAGEYVEGLGGCQTFMSNSTKMGLSIMLTYFIEEIRYLKRVSQSLDVLRAETGHEFNLTIIGTDQYYERWPDKDQDPDGYALYESRLRIKDFDYEGVHLRLNVMFISIIYPNYANLIERFQICLADDMENSKLLYIIIISIYLGIIFLFYIFIWIPFEQRLNQTIYKTKNMLSIIPKEVLASLTNIHKLLDIGQNLSKGQNRVPGKN